MSRFIAPAVVGAIVSRTFFVFKRCSMGSFCIGILLINELRSVSANLGILDCLAKVAFIVSRNSLAQSIEFVLLDELPIDACCAYSGFTISSYFMTALP